MSRKLCAAKYLGNKNLIVIFYFTYRQIPFLYWFRFSNKLQFANFQYQTVANAPPPPPPEKKLWVLQTTLRAIASTKIIVLWQFCKEDEIVPLPFRSQVYLSTRRFFGCESEAYLYPHVLLSRLLHTRFLLEN